MIRDWQYMLDTEQGCYHLEDDPLQNKNLYHSKERSFQVVAPLTENSRSPTEKYYSAVRCL